MHPNRLPKQHPDYIKWYKSLQKRPPVWNKGLTKETHPSLKKTSNTLKNKKIDNFEKWRNKAYKEGLILKTPPKLTKNSNLAFLIGMALGDGHIQIFSRTERLIITLGTDKPKLITFTANSVRKAFNKNPKVTKAGDCNAAHISLYQKDIAVRMGVPAGSKKDVKLRLPNWIWNSKEYLIACLRGLYEAEASLCIHLPTGTYNFAFHNRNQHLLDEVEKALKTLELNPNRRKYEVRLRRKKEVEYFSKLVNFRKYDNAGWSNW